MNFSGSSEVTKGGAYGAAGPRRLAETNAGGSLNTHHSITIQSGRGVGLASGLSKTQIKNDRVNRWRKANPDKWRKIAQRSKAKRREKDAQWFAVWRPQNTARTRAAAKAYDAKMSDGMMTSRLREAGILNPTPQQLETKRRMLILFRARRALKLLAYGT